MGGVVFGTLNISRANKNNHLGFIYMAALSIHQQPSSFLLLWKILCHYKSLTPSKSMPKAIIRVIMIWRENVHMHRRLQSNPCVLKTSRLITCPFCRTQNTSKAHNDIKFGNEVKGIMVVDTHHFNYCFLGLEITYNFICPWVTMHVCLYVKQEPLHC